MFEECCRIAHISTIAVWLHGPETFLAKYILGLLVSHPELIGNTCSKKTSCLLSAKKTVNLKTCLVYYTLYFTSAFNREKKQTLQLGINLYQRLITDISHDKNNSEKNCWRLYSAHVVRSRGTGTHAGSLAGPQLNGTKPSPLLSVTPVLCALRPLKTLTSVCLRGCSGVSRIQQKPELEYSPNRTNATKKKTLWLLVQTENRRTNKGMQKPGFDTMWAQCKPTTKVFYTYLYYTLLIAFSAVSKLNIFYINFFFCKHSNREKHTSILLQIQYKKICVTKQSKHWP